MGYMVATGNPEYVNRNPMFYRIATIIATTRSPSSAHLLFAGLFPKYVKMYAMLRPNIFQWGRYAIAR